MIDVAAAIIEHQGKVLAARRKPGSHNGGLWEFPGGKIEPGETARQCLMRELEEELGIQSQIGDVVGENIHHIEGKGPEKTIRLLAYKVRHTGGEIQLLDHDQILWLTPDQLHTLNWSPADIPLVACYQAQWTTSNYYLNNAKNYALESQNFAVDNIHAPLISKLQPGAHILDLGCGSGRDSKAFIDAGFKVTAIDSCEPLTKLAAKHIGQPVHHLSFLELDYDREFDAIWACASLLHCPKSQMPHVLARVMKALKPGGIAFMSFKWGNDETVDDKGRFFNNYTKTSLHELLQQNAQVYVHRIWSETTPLRGSEQQWVSALVGAVNIETARFPEKHLTVGGDDHFLPGLLSAIDHASEINIAAAFITEQGLSLLFESLTDALRRKAKINLLTGDYLYFTSPEALRLLLVLKAQGADVRIFESGQKQSFHMKAYLFVRAFSNGRDQGCAFVGSSNITKMALRNGLEWNLCVDRLQDEARFTQILGQFDNLFKDSRCKILSNGWIESYQKRIPKRAKVIPGLLEVDEPIEVPVPNPIQAEALVALTQTRAQGYRRGLVVLATGLGKTWLAAFDSTAVNAQRILFVAHREEILEQAEQTFLKIKTGVSAGYYTGKKQELEADMLFASIQTLGRTNHLNKFAKDHFDYIIVDEFHHAAARTYKQLLAHFTPKFLLGLTATPERTDQVDILALCDDNEVYRKDLFEGIESKQLCPFNYFGLYDEAVDYQEIKWRNGKFDPDQLFNQLATVARAKHNFDQWQLHHQQRTLAFCISRKHADFMANYFNNHDVKAISVHSESKVQRKEALKKLAKGEVDIIFSVDLFNEGVDLPSIDTVLMLRPTESAIIFLQQLGRGLRTNAGKSKLIVLDFIGNHISFFRKATALFKVGASNKARNAFTKNARNETLELPDGCFVNYDIEVIEFMEKLTATRFDQQAALYQSLKEMLGRRPSLPEFVQARGGLDAIRKEHEQWLTFVDTQGDLSANEAACVASHQAYFRELETTTLTKSFKMVTLEAMLELDGFSKPPTTLQLALQSWEILHRRRVLLPDLHSDFQGFDNLPTALQSKWHNYWKTNPIKAWAIPTPAQKKANAKLFFTVEEQAFTCAERVEAIHFESFENLTQELVNYGFYRYNERKVTAKSAKPVALPVELMQQVPYFSDLKIACGHFASSTHDTDNIEMRQLPLSYGKLNPAKHFIAKAKGNSMNGGKNPIKNNDYLLLEIISPIAAGSNNGKIVAIERQDVTGDDQYLLRMVNKLGPGEYQLLAQNPDYEPMMASEDMTTFARLKGVVELGDLKFQ